MTEVTGVRTAFVMKIRKIMINGFGKLTDRSYSLSDGLNVVYGNNEAGKSTLHRFIGAVFFGFFKPYSKNRQYTSDIDRFRPWNTDNYSGSISYDTKDGSYTVYRNFSKKSESVSMFDEKAGRDITNSLEFDPVQKMFRIDRDLGVSRVLFDNTVSISQMKSATGEELSREIGELLVRARDSHSADISYSGSLERIRRLRESVGTRRQSRSRMGSAAARLEELRQEYDRALKVKSEVESAYMDIRALEEEDRSLQLREQSLTDAIRAEEALRVVERYDEYIALKEDIEKDRALLDTRLTIDEGDYERYLRYSSAAEEARSGYEELCSSEQKALKALDILNEKGEKIKDILEQGADSIREDSLLYYGLSERLEKIRSINAESRQEELRKRIGQLRNRKNILLVLACVLLAASGCMAALTYFGVISSDLYRYSLIVAGLSLMAFAGFGAALYAYKKAEPRSIRFDTLMQKSIAVEVAATAQMDALMEKYSARDAEELERIFARSDELQSSYRDYTEKKNKVEAGLESIGSQKEAALAKQKHYTNLRDSILAEAGAPDEDTMRRMIEITRQLENIRQRLEDRTARMKKLLGDESEDSLREEAESLREISLRAKDDDSALSRMKLEEVRTRRSEIAARTANLSGIITASEAGCRPLNIIDEEIGECERELEECEKLSDAYALAEETIVNVSRELKGDFSEIFNGFISGIASEITAGKYTQVKVDEDMHVSVFDTESSRYADINELSGATIDQLYFAVRFAIAELLIEDKTVPIFLDDCFVQYDDDRLRNILRYLGDVSSRRQVLLFTCRPNEMRCLEDMGIEYREVLV